jgi:hypothetical protein
LIRLERNDINTGWGHQSSEEDVVRRTTVLFALACTVGASSLATCGLAKDVPATGGQEAYLTWMWEFNSVTFDGTYTGQFSGDWTFSGQSVSGPVDVVGSVTCTGHNVPNSNWSEGTAMMDCTANFPASNTHGPLVWQGAGGGNANYDGYLVKGSGRGTYSDDNGVHDSGIEVFSMRAGLTPR